MAKPRASTAVECNTCNKTIGRRADLARHMRTHATNKEELMHACPYRGCTYKTLQRSNLVTHLNVHSRERPNKCPEAGCDFSSSDPGSLTRHRKEIHSYEPKANAGSHPSAITRKAARQQRRISPYTSSSSTSPSNSPRSASPLDPSSGIYHSPRPQVPQMLDLSPPSSLLLANAHGENGIKNTSAAYSTELITKLPQVNNSSPAPNPEQENSLPLASGPSTAPEAHTAECPQLPAPEQGNLYAADLPAQSVPAETTPVEVSDAMLDEFLAQFDIRHAKTTAAYTAPSLPAPLVPYTVNNVHAPTPASIPSYEVQYAVDNVIMPTPASLPAPLVPYTVDNVHVPTPAFLPSYEYQYTVDDVTVPIPASLPSYEDQYTVHNASYSYPTDAVSFDAQFSRPRSFTAPNMGFYPQVGDQPYFYTAPAAMSGFSMQGIYPF